MHLNKGSRLKSQFYNSARIEPLPHGVVFPRVPAVRDEDLEEGGHHQEGRGGSHHDRETSFAGTGCGVISATVCHFCLFWQ